MHPVEISSLSDPRVCDYRDLRDADLRGLGRFVVEGRLNVRRLIEDSQFRVRSLFLTPTALETMRDCAERVAATAGLFVASQEILNGVVGFNMHRGCLAVAERGAPRKLEDLELHGRAGRGLVVALDDLSDQENVGGVFRNAMAFGVDAVLLSPRCCDPLFRKALRVSMGGALRVPHLRASQWPGDLARLRADGFELVALDASEDADPIESLEKCDRSVVLVAGAEGPGLSPEVRALCDRRARIPMAPEIDSLNVATSVAIALHRLSAGRLASEGRA